jgi:glycosyltransferase involved in cell wall biosynthesis
MWQGGESRGDASTFLSIVTPMYNESDGIVQFLCELRTVLTTLDIHYEVILVDDGSQDDSVAKAVGIGWSDCRILALARNCGHQIAIEAGLAVAGGTWVLTMDSDGQHPPNVIPAMLEAALSQDVDVVYTVQSSRSTDSRGKRIAALAYYRVIRGLTGISVADSQADFRLISRQVLSEIQRVPGDKVLRLLLPAVGYESVTLEYEVRQRIAGSGRYGFGRQLQMAASSLLNFSAKPLRVVAGLGVLLSFGAMLWLTYVLITFMLTKAVAGWSSVMAAVLVVGGITLLSVSIVGEYVARIHDLLKGHPRYSARFVSTPETGHEEKESA